MWLYNFGLTLYVWLIRLVAPRHPKARLWIDGRKDLYKRMAETIDPTDRIVWVHVASLGEFEQGRPIIERCLLYTSPSPRDRTRSRMPSSA